MQMHEDCVNISRAVNWPIRRQEAKIVISEQSSKVTLLNQIQPGRYSAMKKGQNCPIGLNRCPGLWHPTAAMGHVWYFGIAPLCCAVLRKSGAKEDARLGTSVSSRHYLRWFHALPEVRHGQGRIWRGQRHSQLQFYVARHRECAELAVDGPGLRLSLRRCCLLTKHAARVLNKTAAARKQIVATTPATTGRARPSSATSAGGKGSGGHNGKVWK